MKNHIKVKKWINRFEKWIKLYKCNHYARFMFIKAKSQEVYTDSMQVGLLYGKGIEFAKEHNQLQLVALGNILAGRYYNSNKKISEMYKQEVIFSLEKWGATHYSKLLKERYGVNSDADKLREVDAREAEQPQAFMSGHRVSYHMKKVESMSKDDTYTYMLNEVVCENSADYGAIFMENNDQIDMEYEWRSGRSEKLNKAMNMEDVMMIPHKVMRYVVRTGEAVLMDKKPSIGLFVNDSYFDDKVKISLLCIPIKYMDVFAGVIYLEWGENKTTLLQTADAIKNYIPLLLAKTKLELDEAKQQIAYDMTETPLTKREEEVYKLLIKGLTNKQIGDELVISLSTVKTHIINIYSKLNIKNRVAAVEKAKALGFTE